MPEEWKFTGKKKEAEKLNLPLGFLSMGIHVFHFSFFPPPMKVRR